MPAGLVQESLDQLLKRAEASKSDAVVIYKDGKLVGEWTFGKPEGPIEAMSATKSVVNLAIGRLIDTGKLTSLDQPVHELFPEWRQGRKQKITIRHLLNHTSGLQNEKSTAVDIYPSPDFVKLALAAELSDEPGARFSYNNKAVNLLAGVVKVASGKRMDTYLRDEIFAPLGITDFSWTLDRAGNPHAMSGLQIRARDLAKLGQLMLDGGVWQGKRILSKKWIDESTRAGQWLNPSCGLLWWLKQGFRGMVADDLLIAEWRKAGNSEAFISKVLPLKDKVFEDRKAFFAALEQAFGGKPGLEIWYDNTWRKGLPDGKMLPSTTLGFYADGYLGQYLVVIPADRLVAVRQLRAPDGQVDASKIDAFPEFPELVRALVTPSRR
jgi:CubicO group peptidase (beta-lactamase class C family)